MRWVYYIVSGGIGVLYFGSALFDIFNDWPRFQAKQEKRGMTYSKRTNMVAAYTMLMASLFVLLLGHSDYKEKHPSVPKTIEEVNRFVSDTLTYSNPITTENKKAKYWQRWVINKNGTMTIYRAIPASTNWGNPYSASFDIITEKYQDTGARFFAIRVIGTQLWAIIEEDGALLVKEGDVTVAILERGDVFPFSK